MVERVGWIAQESSGGHGGLHAVLVLSMTLRMPSSFAHGGDQCDFAGFAGGALAQELGTQDLQGSDIPPSPFRSILTSSTANPPAFPFFLAFSPR